MQINDVSVPNRSLPAQSGISTTFSEWANSHRARGGDFDEGAFAAGAQAFSAAYGSGLSLHEAFEVGRQAFYSALS